MKRNFELIYKCSEYCILRILDYKASVSYSLHTNWCSILKSKFDYTFEHCLMYRVLFKDKINMRITIPIKECNIPISFGLGGKNDNTKIGIPKCKESPEYSLLNDNEKFYYYQQISPRYTNIFQFDEKDYGNRTELIRRIRMLNDDAKNSINKNITKNILLYQ